MLDNLITWDYQWFGLLYQEEGSALEPLMQLMSEKAIWIPLYLVIIQQTITKFGKQAWIPLVGMILVVVAADQLTSAWMKPYFSRLRPCHDPLLEMVEFTRKCGGRFGFASSHAANTMGLAVFVNFLFKGPSPRWLCAWALGVAYSRVFLGVHFPLDTLAGMGIGAMLATIVWLLVRRLLQPKLPSLQ